MKIEDYTTQALAYLGDVVMELQVRSHLVNSGISTSRDLNKLALNYVRAGAQAEAMKKLLPILSEQELLQFKRGRNLGHGNVPKNATVAEYRTATGMEVLFGYLYVTENTERIRELFTIAYLQGENNEKPDNSN